MNDRIKKLRSNSLKAIPCISAERALLITEYYKENTGRSLSVPELRADSFDYILQKKKVAVFGDELIVGERGPVPKAVPTYPEITLHSLEDLDILNAREKVSYKVDSLTRKAYEEVIIPFWKGRSQREKIMSLLNNEWKEAYSAGVFTEFQEQRAPGHTVNGKKIYSKGLNDFIAEIDQRIEELDYFRDPQAMEKHEELRAMKVSAKALINFAGRYAKELRRLAGNEKREWRKEELQNMALICDRVPAESPRNFHEALQYYWFVHIGVITETNPWDSFNPGRLDQHLYPFYMKGVADGSLTEEYARELLQSFWIKFNNHPAPPKVGVTAQESNTYTDFTLINLGGVKEDGSNAVNDLSYIILDVIEEMRILQPGSMIQVSKKNPDNFIKRALSIIKTGFGQPSVFNTDAIIQELLMQGKDLTDARNGGASGCVESGAFGTESYILSGYFNLTKILEITLNNGSDPVTGRQIGVPTGDPVHFQKFDDLLEAFRKQLDYFIDIKIRGNNIILKLFEKHIPVPFLSLFIDDCIKNGRDYNAGGARYNTTYIQGVGLGSMTNSLTALKTHVFEKRTISMKAMLDALKRNFEGYEEFRNELIYHTPKYGNDDNLADDQAVTVFQYFFESVNERPTSTGGKHRVNMLPTTSHVYFGSVIMATPDGRKAGVPLSEGISPVQGTDTQGPTAVLKSASKIDHIKAGGTLLNQRFTPEFFKDNEALDKLTALIRSYFSMDGHHIQFNVIHSETLKDAQMHPENYGDLIVRVAGYSDYFNDLGKDLQDEIIARTAQNI